VGTFDKCRNNHETTYDHENKRKKSNLQTSHPDYQWRCSTDQDNLREASTLRVKYQYSWRKSRQNEISDDETGARRESNTTCSKAKSLGPNNGFTVWLRWVCLASLLRDYRDRAPEDGDGSSLLPSVPLGPLSRGATPVEQQADYGNSKYDQSDY